MKPKYEQLNPQEIALVVQVLILGKMREQEIMDASRLARPRATPNYNERDTWYKTYNDPYSNYCIARDFRHHWFKYKGDSSTYNQWRVVSAWALKELNRVKK